MADRTKIEWCRGDDGSAGATWNPIVGCSPVSEGCLNCYARAMAGRGMAATHREVAAWDGTVRLVESQLDEPLYWRKPRRIFVCSMGDLFHENVTDELRDRVFAVAALCPQHQFYVLTKRAERMQKYVTPLWSGTTQETYRVGPRGCALASGRITITPNRPLPNVHLGVTVENQARLLLRGSLLQDTPAAARFYSAEPLLSQLDFHAETERGVGETLLDGITEVFVGCETGPRPRPCPHGWVRSVVEQCREAGVSVLVKALAENEDGTGRIIKGDALPEWARRSDAEQQSPRCR